MGELHGISKHSHLLTEPIMPGVMWRHCGVLTVGKLAEQGVWGSWPEDMNTLSPQLGEAVGSCRTTEQTYTHLEWGGNIREMRTRPSPRGVWSVTWWAQRPLGRQPSTHTGWSLLNVFSNGSGEGALTVIKETPAHLDSFVLHGWTGEDVIVVVFGHVLQEVANLLLPLQSTHLGCDLRFHHYTGRRRHQNCSWGTRRHTNDNWTNTTTNVLSDIHRRYEIQSHFKTPLCTYQTPFVFYFSRSLHYKIYI